MKWFKNKKGFSLIELMIAVGLTSVVILVVMQAQKSSVKAVGDLEVAGEINGLIQLITTEFSKAEVCTNNLKTKTYNGTTPNIGQIYSSGGKKLIEVNQKYGTKIDSIDSIVLVSSNVSKVATLTVTYTPHTRPVQQQSFSVSVNVFSDATGTTIDSCYSDEYTALRDAVSYACQGDGATYLSTVGTYGTCLHNVTLKDNAGSDVPTFKCPNGEVLRLTSGSGPNRILQCKKINTVGVPCGTWEYMEGIDSAGAPICKKILNLFGASTGIMATTSPGTWQIISLNCPAGQILLSVGAGWAPTCVDPKLTSNCPTGQVLMGVTSTGALQCGYYPNDNTCAGGSYLKAVTNAGVVTCAYPTLSGSCTPPQVVNGTTAGGGVTCATMPY